MKRIKQFFLLMLALIVLIAIGIYGYLHSTKPSYEGELSLKNLTAETQVYFDDYGIPHIYAQNQKDALTALGYVHAQDRLWQMELLRRIAPGKLSEIFGSRALDNDKLFLALGIDKNSDEAIAKLDKNSPAYQLAHAYLDGINQYIENGKTPVEFTLLGIEKKPFTLKDVYNTFGYMAFSFAMAQRTDPLLTDLRNKWGDEYLKELGIDYSFNTVKIKVTEDKTQQYIEASKAVTALMESSPVPPFIGSNSWVVGPQKTKNGRVIFANDPHIEYSQPGTWYEAHISCQDYEMYGYYLAGTPFPLLGHNRDYAYGLTMFENDDADFFQEENNPSNVNQYKTAKGYSDFKVRNEVIKIKDSAEVKLTINETDHGPVMNGILKDFKPQKPVSFHWIYTQQPNHILEAVYSLSHAKDIEDFHKNIELIAAPGLNIMYGDAKNNVGWFTSGKLYKLEKEVNPNFILSGTNGRDDKKTFLEFSKNPYAQNPSWGYVYSANNMPEAIDGYNYQGYYLPKDRARRITHLLDNKNEWDKESIGSMINDNTSMESQEVAKNMVSAINVSELNQKEQEALSVLKSWKGNNDLSEVSPTVYNKLLYFYLVNTFKDEMGDDAFKQYIKTYVMKQTIAYQSKNEKSLWWDNIATKDKKETRAEILTKAFKEAVGSLQNQLGDDVNGWTWNRVHKIEYKHPLGSVSILRPLFNVGIFEIPGGNEVINNTMFELSDEPVHMVKSGPSTRRVIDFSDIENSWSVLPSGQSGNPMSPHYNDQAELYVQGKFRKMKLNKKEIEASSTKLVFEPK
ncbi:penicillin acylase family protein [Flavobacterium sp. GCM10027622]|uniref:penicillin acylase family protein n=1 Tax=unclassified Flavobacterium TaxID=196869 RepID=UPI00361E2149